MLSLLLLVAGADPGVRLLSPQAPPPKVIPSPFPPSKGTITPEVRDYIDSDVPLILLVVPEGILEPVLKNGPITVNSKFIDNPTVFAEKEFKGKYVYWLKPLQTGACEILIGPVGAKSEKDFIRKQTLVDMNLGPKPPPVPPEPEPDGTSPFKEPGLRVLIVYEASGPVSSEQVGVIFGKKTRDYLDAHCVKVGTNSAYRIYDKDTDLSGAPEPWKGALARPRKSIPWVIIGNGKTGYEGPLPDTEAAFIELVSKYEVKP